MMEKNEMNQPSEWVSKDDDDFRGISISGSEVDSMQEGIQQ